jgi:glycine oxidase
MTEDLGVNVVIVGAGVIGASIANALARRGASVTVLDMRAPGRGASWASAGLLAPYTEAQEATPLLRMGIRSLSLFDEFVANARTASARAIEYSRTGTFEIASTDDAAAHLLGVKAWLDRAGVTSEWIEGAAAREFEPSIAPHVRGGLFIPAHGFVGVGSLVSALLHAARFAGATLESPVEAVDVTPTRGGGVVVRAGERRYQADRVVIAAGSWSRRVRVAGIAPLPVRPVRGQLLHLRWTAALRPTRPIWGPGCYTVPWSDGTLLVGATVEEAGFDESTTVDGVNSLTSAVIAMLPGAATAALIDARAGLRPATEDGLPIIGTSQMAPGVMFATGHFRNGILLAPLTAAMVEAALIDRQKDGQIERQMDAMMTETSPDRFVNTGGGR